MTDKSPHVATVAENEVYALGDSTLHAFLEIAELRGVPRHAASALLINCLANHLAGSASQQARTHWATHLRWLADRIERAEAVAIDASDLTKPKGEVQ